MAADARLPGQWFLEARAGSNEALGNLLEGCRNYLLLVARQELDPELKGKANPSDLVQETFLEAARDFQRFEGTTEAELLAWLRQLLRHNIANFRRDYRATEKRSVDREVSLGTPALGGEEPMSAALSPSGEAVAREKVEALDRAMQQLPEDYRRVLLLRHQEEHSFEEIAQVMERSPNAVRKLWGRAVKALQQQLDALR